MRKATLRRYTNLAATLHILRNRCLTLLNPASWDDRNDAFYMARYKERIGASSVLALCFAEASETYHHWRVFSSGSDGVCIEFDKVKLRSVIRHEPSVRAREVDYREINDVRAAPIEDDDLPFLKRSPYQDEQEYRLLYVSHETTAEFHHLRLPSLSSISRITLSPWMPAALVTSVKETLKEIEGCKTLKIYRSTLVDNERWKKAAKPDLDFSGDR